MSCPVKILLIDKEDKLGNGLAAIRTRKNELIDITATYEDALSDATTIGGPSSHFIKDNKVYRICKHYFDYDTKSRVYIAILDMEPFDTYPIPPSKNDKG